MAPQETIHSASPTLGAFLLLDGLYHWTTLNGILDAARGRASVIVYGSPSPTIYNQLDAQSVAATYLLKGDQVDGMLFLFAQAGLQAYAHQLHHSGYPVCLVARRFAEVPTVICDNFEALRRSVAGLIERGHRKIGFIAGPPENLSADDRLKGYQQALADHQIPFDPDLVGLGGFVEEDARRTAANLIKHHRPTAIIAANDIGAVGVLAAAREAHLVVPKDIEILGFDDILRTRWLSPPLSTHSFDRFQMAFVATDELLRRLEGKPYRAEIKVEAEVVLRGTTRNFHGPTYCKTERSQSAFFCTVQLAELRKNPLIGARLSRLESNTLTSEEFITLLTEVVNEIERADRDVTLLFPWLERRVGGFLPGPDDPTVRAARDLLSESAFNQQLKQREEALEFASATHTLRDLAFQAEDEGTLLTAFAQVLHDLALRRVGIFLLPSSSDEATGEWYWWQAGKAAGLATPTLISPQEFNLPKLLEQEVPASWVALPILYHGESFGLIALESESPFLQHFPDLVRSFSAALHGTRMLAALTRINEARREAQAAAEQFAADLAISNAALSASECFYHSLVESLPQGIVRKDNAGKFTYVNSNFGKLFNKSAETLLGKTDAQLYPESIAAKYRADELEMMRTGQPLEYEQVLVEQKDKPRYLHVKKNPLRDNVGATIGLQILFWDITPFRETEHLLRKAHQDLIEASRLAGIAEIATAVLHNLGNALNGVTTSAGLIMQKLQDSRLVNLFKLGELVSAQKDIADFLARDPRGLAMPRYLQQLALALKEEHRSLIEESRALQNNVLRAAEIVAAQQGHAVAVGEKESIPPRELVECALRLCDSLLQRQGVQVDRHFHSVGSVRVKRHQALQIITNLIKNAIEAMETLPPENQRLTVGFTDTPDSKIAIYVKDQGIGVPSDHLNRIFEYGFTTKKTGRGFSLHTSALAAQEMEGVLSARNNANGPGATFLLTLPSETGEINLNDLKPEQFVNHE